jgi:hypothetical protein
MRRLWPSLKGLMERREREALRLERGQLDSGVEAVEKTHDVSADRAFLLVERGRKQSMLRSLGTQNEIIHGAKNASIGFSTGSLGGVNWRAR